MGPKSSPLQGHNVIFSSSKPNNLPCHAKSGANNPNAALSDADVMDIYKSNASIHTLCEKYHISPSAIKNIDYGTTWNHITGVSNTNKYSHITPAMALEIYRLDISGDLLALQYNVSRFVVRNIKSGITWTKVTGAKKES